MNTTPTYLINLASRPDRLATATERLADTGLVVECVAAKTYESALEAGVRFADDLRGRRAMTAGDLGCVASHMEVYRHIIERGQRGALILEDDFYPVVDFGERVRSSLSLAPPAGILKLGWLGYKHRLQSRVRDSAVRARRKARRDRWEPHSFAFGTHCYWASAEFAEFALGYMNPVFAAIDNMVTAAVQESSHKAFRHWPPLAIQDDSPSDIDKRIHGAAMKPKW